jgi:hypothetical protein
MNSITDVKTRLSEIQAAISGVRKAFVDAPPSIVEADLPLCMNFSGPATNDYEIFGDGEALQARDYTMRLYVTPIQAGESGEAEKAVEGFLPLVYGAFFSRPGLSSATAGHTSPLAGVVNSFILSDSGVTVLPFAGASFLGIEFKLRVRENISFTYANGE